MKLMFGAFVDENEIVRICKHISKVFKGIVGKRGGKPIGQILLFVHTDPVFPRFPHERQSRHFHKAG
jgi:hypothetical protein